MTSLERALRERGISKYRFIQLMGGNPRNDWNFWNNKILGKAPITMDELLIICDNISKETGKFMNSDEIQYRPKHVYII